MKTIVAISGSLKKDSINTSLLVWLKKQAPLHTTISIFEGIGELPHFNPDNDKPGMIPHDAVEQMRRVLAVADGVIISTPEYAKGIPGVLKNALDWLVSSGELVNKRVGTISASPLQTAGQTAHDSLLATLGMVTATLDPKGAVSIPFAGQKIHNGIITDEKLSNDLKALLNWVISED